jgi:hypothetical protein
MLKKLIAPFVIGGVLLGGVAWAGVAGAAAPAATASASAAPVAHTGKHALRAWLRTHRRELRREGVAISAKTIGVTPKALVAELKSGQSIAEVAAAHGVSTQTVVNALSSAADAKISQAVTDHKLTSTQAAKIEAALPSYLTKAVNHIFT